MGILGRNTINNKERGYMGGEHIFIFNINNYILSKIKFIILFNNNIIILFNINFNILFKINSNILSKKY